MEINGKVYRNLEGQVGYLTDKYDDLQNQIDEVRAQIPSKMIVEELPEEGDPLITYYVGPKGTAPNQYYEVWIWVQEEEDGPFVWRELEDTDQVDLSGYLPIQDGATTLPQVYGKTEAGEQAMVNMDINATALTIPFRDANGRMKVAAPSADEDAVNKKYVGDNFVVRRTDVTSAPTVYGKASDGSVDSFGVSTIPTGYYLVQRKSDGRINVPDPIYATEAASKNYVDSNFLAKQTGTSVYHQAYVKLADGSQAMLYIGSDVDPNLIVRRTGAGQINVPTVPTDNAHAASKKYVDDAVGQLLYLHDINLVFTIDASNYLIVRGHLINGSATAITSLKREQFARINVEYGSYGTSNNASDVSANAICSVTKLPGSFRFNDFVEPYAGFLYQYVSGSTLLWGVADNNMTVTVTDVVVSF